jgi:hypothetical protein
MTLGDQMKDQSVDEDEESNGIAFTNEQIHKVETHVDEKFLPDV